MFKKLLVSTILSGIALGLGCSSDVVAKEVKKNQKNGSEKVKCTKKTDVKSAKKLIYGKFDGYILATGKWATVIIDNKGKIVWSFKAGNNHDVWMLKNGNVLFADGQVREVNPKTNKVVWSYKPKVTKGGGAYSCQRLDNGNTLVGENSTGRILEVNSKGKIVFELQTKPYKAGSHGNMRMVRKTKEGTYLIAFSGKKMYREYAADGKILWEKKVNGALAFSIVKLPNGHYLTGQVNSIIEYDKKGKEIWKFDPKKDIKDLKIGMICGINVLPNGNIAFGIYRIVQDQKNGAALMEITRDKKVVWRYIDTKYRPGAMMSLEVLDKNKKALSELR